MIFVKENKKGTAVIAVGGFFAPPSYVDKKKKIKEKNERREKSEERKSPEPVFVPANDGELWIFSVIMIISLWG